MSYDQTARDYSPKDPYANQLAEKQAAWAHGQEPKSNRYVGQATLGPDKNEGGVIRGMRRMEKQLMELSTAVDNLSDRLSMVRVSYPKSEEGTERSVEGSGLASQIFAYGQALEFQTARLQQLMQELDL
jgi:hypothetical protein